MSDYTKALGDAVLAARSKSGLTQADLAARIGVDVKTIWSIEKYKANPRTDVLFPLIRELQIDPVDIFYPAAKRNDETFLCLQALLAECSSEEISMLIPIIESVITHTRLKDKIIIEK